MAIVNICGFETGDLVECNSSGGTCSISSGVTRTGTYSLRINPTTSGIGFVQIMPLSVNGNNNSSADATITNPVYARFYFRIATLPANSEEFLSIYGNSDVLKMTLRVNNTGKILVYSSNGTTLLGTGSTSLLLNTWYRIEVKTGSGASAPWEVKINGTVELSGTSNNIGSNFRAWCLGKRTNFNNGSVDFYYDDAVFSDSGYPGQGGVKLMRPDSDGTVTNWTASTGNRWSCVREVPHTGDNNYISHNGGGADNNDVGLESTATRSISGNIKSVKCVTIGRRSGGGIIADTSMYIPKIVSGGVTVAPGAAGLNSTTYTFFGVIAETDPNTGVAWTTSGLDAVQLRVTSNISQQLRVTSMLLNVDFDSGESSYSYDTSGTLSFNGLATPYITLAHSVNGKLILSGLGLPQSNYSSNTVGSLSANGLADVINEHIYDSAGQLTFNGAIEFANSYLYLASGSLLWEGTTEEVLTVNYLSYGLLSLLGQSPPSSSYFQESEGRLLVSGVEPVIDIGCTYDGSGYITFRDRTLLAWWRLDEGTGTNLNDSSLYKRTGTAYNTPTWVSGNTAIRYGSPYALEFDGFTQYAQASANGLTNRAMTILIWAKPRSLPNEVNVSHFFRDMVGSILWIGEATERTAGIYYGLGSLLFRGLADCFNSNSVEPGGKLTFTGLASTRTAALQELSTYHSLSGTASYRVGSVIVPTGRLLLQGLAEYVTTMTHEASGRLIFNGLIRVNSVTALVEGTGQLTITGLGKTFSIYTYAPSGSLVLSGTSAPRSSYSMNAAGKLLFSGLNMSINQTPYIMVPDGDAYSFGSWTNSDLGTSNFYQYVDEGTVSPNDSDYIFNGFVTGTANAEIIFTLTDTPTSFRDDTVATAVMIYVRQARTSDKGTPQQLEEVQIMESDNTTAITAIASASSDGTIRTYAYGPTITGNNNKTAWDGARLRLKVNAGTNGSVQIYAAQVVLYYNAALNVQPTGKLTFSGTANPQQDFTYDTSGSLVINGMASAEAAGYIASGQLGLSGIVQTTIGGIVNMVGSLIIGGAATIVDGNMWLYTVNDTFTPDFTGNISVECWAGGGGGGVTQSHGTGGGGGGAYSKLNTFAVTSGNNYTVNVGTGGIQNVTGDSWFNSTGTVFAAQGINGGSSGGGAGGQAVNCIGDVIHEGGGGGNSGSNGGGAGGGSSGGTAADGNIGADSSGSAGANGGAAVTNGGAGGNGGNSGVDGQDGTVPGGAGGGAGGSANPGAGARGQIILRRL